MDEFIRSINIVITFEEVYHFILRDSFVKELMQVKRYNRI